MKRFSTAKIEMLLNVPENPAPNQLYLIENSEEPTRLYLSDSKSQLHLLNAPGDSDTEIFIEYIQDIIGNALDGTMIYDDVANTIGVNPVVLAGLGMTQARVLTLASLRV